MKSDHYILVNRYTIFFFIVLNIFYSQLHMNGIQQQAMLIQALSFLHVQGIHWGECLLTVLVR